MCWNDLAIRDYCLLKPCSWNVIALWYENRRGKDDDFLPMMIIEAFTLHSQSILWVAASLIARDFLKGELGDCHADVLDCSPYFTFKFSGLYDVKICEGANREVGIKRIFVSGLLMRILSLWVWTADSRSDNICRKDICSSQNASSPGRMRHSTLCEQEKAKLILEMLSHERTFVIP